MITKLNMELASSNVTSDLTEALNSINIPWLEDNLLKSMQDVSNLGFNDNIVNPLKGAESEIKQLHQSLGNHIAPILSNFYSASGKFRGIPISKDNPEPSQKNSYKSNLEGATHR